MLKALAIPAVLALSACVSVPTEPVSDGLVRVKNSVGSLDVRVVEQHIAEMRWNGQRAILGQEYCWSACTLYLAVAECVGADTQFGFHAAMHSFVENRAETVRLANAYYPGKLRDHFLYTSASDLDIWGIEPMNGVDVSYLTGVPLCPS